MEFRRLRWPRLAGVCVCWPRCANAASLRRGTERPLPPPKLPAPEGATRLSPKYDVWVDAKRGVVLVDGQVSLRRGMLEMFACIRNTKEHESVVTADTQAFLVHAGLLRLGAEPGHPAQFVPEFKPPAGTEIDVSVEWRDEQGKTADGQGPGLGPRPEDRQGDDVSVGVRRQPLLDRRGNRQAVLPGRRGRLHLRLELRHRGARHPGRELAVERRAGVRGVHRADSAAGDAGAAGAQAGAEESKEQGAGEREREGGK